MSNDIKCNLAHRLVGAVITFLFAFTIVSCSTLIGQAGAPSKVVDTVATAEDILCIAGTTGLPFESKYNESWIHAINTYCAIRSGYQTLSLTSQDAEQRLSISCVNTSNERQQLTDTHSAYIEAWETVCNAQ